MHALPLGTACGNNDRDLDTLVPALHSIPELLKLSNCCQHANMPSPALQAIMPTQTYAEWQTNGWWHDPANKLARDDYGIYVGSKW
jgi:hypothetical protein